MAYKSSITIKFQICNRMNIHTVIFTVTYQGKHNE